MRVGVLGGLLSGAVAAACFISRPSETLECATNEDCASLDGNRQCTDGYCVATSCPDDCTSCNEAARTCVVDCNDGDDCDAAIVCPSGWNCTINCNGAATCENVQCSSGSRCTVICGGADACNAVNCEDACQCDVTCPAGACQSTACPTRGNGGNQVRCTEDGTTATTCDSARAASCASC